MGAGWSSKLWECMKIKVVWTLCEFDKTCGNFMISVWSKHIHLGDVRPPCMVRRGGGA